jgi:cell division protease FtsH
MVIAGSAVVVIVAAVALWSATARETAPVKVPFSTFVQSVQRSPAIFQGATLQIALGKGPVGEVSWTSAKDGSRFLTVGYLDERLLLRLAEANIAFQVVPTAGGLGWGWSLLGALVFLALTAFLVFVVGPRQMGGTLANFRSSPARRLQASQRKVTFADVAGIDEARGELEEVVAFLDAAEKFTRLGGRVPRGVLLMGPPGTGKTLLARAIAGEADVPFFSLSGSDFVEMFVGVGASRVRSVFEEAKKSAPCLIFIDEIDAVGRQRGTGIGGGHDEREQTLNQLLVEMDGFASAPGVILIAATNRPDVLDPALLRPGRFDRRIVVPLPDPRGRRGILEVHTRKTPLASDVDLAVIARGTPGFVGADLEALVNEAALLAARGDKDRLEMVDLEAAKDKVLMGPERRSLVISDKARRIIAYHEAGHALVGKMMKASDPIHKVTIIPRGRALGLTQLLPTEDRLNLSQKGAEDQIAFALAGRVAEEVVFGQITTGAANDIQAASALARNMVSSWGMSPRLGPVYFGRHEQAVFLGRDFNPQAARSEATAVEIDEEVQRIVMEGLERARRIVMDNPDKLKLVAEALLEHETIAGAQIDLLFAGGTIDVVAPADRRPS